ncbi:Piso0_000824 [Millerozyma farinosa CBS 7064]|uniref:superoxide dismutase n=1 Tax=Pichia sorbitophila (strain ATCC MYA-4447 / BCRC 22081 / CBS 7064 / NBRC 10061 / NRRL Y-12695) TaxID=559304 RepID=G8YQ60_PICSO|nr:Piso0_000824 [Millerozyma farinosa CBS 7064]
MQFNLPLILSLLSVAPIVAGKKAPKIKKNPSNVVAIADFPSGFKQHVMGNVIFSAKDGGIMNVHVDMTGLPREGGPFTYHIHENPVPADGNCDLIGDHLNPYRAPLDCDSQKDDSYCQVGDLSGKHGSINATCFETKYNDPYLSLNKKSKAYVVGRSVAFHLDDGSIFACADIQSASSLRLETLKQEYATNEITDSNDQDEVEAAEEEGDDEAEYHEAKENNEKDDDDQRAEQAEENANESVSKSVSDFSPINSTSANATNVSALGEDCENSSSGLSSGLTFAAIAAAAVSLLI